MATKLTKPVRRELSRVQATKRGRIEMPDRIGFVPVGCRPVIVSLLPNETIEFRVKNTRTRYIAHLATIMAVAQRITFYDAWMEKKRLYKLKKDAGHKRLRDPRKPHDPAMARFFRKLL